MKPTVGEHISFSTNIGALIKQFSIVKVSDCERHTRVRREASLSPVMWHVIRPVKPPLWPRCFRAGRCFLAGLKWHTRALRGNSSRCWAIVMTTVAQSPPEGGGIFEALLPHPFYISGRLGRLALFKIYFGNNFFVFKEIWNDSRESLTRTIRSLFSFIAKFSIECVRPVWGGNSAWQQSPNPPPFISIFSLGSIILFGLKLQKVPQSFSFLYHLVEDCPVWLFLKTFFKTKCFFVWNHSVHILTSLK